jgi:hypothetical protein
MVKWFGTSLKLHPYSKIKFRSHFKILMDRISSIKNLKMTDLTFFKPDDTRKYSANYIQK